MKNNKTVQLGLVCKDNSSNDFELKGKELNQPAVNFKEVYINSVTEGHCLPEVINITINADVAELSLRRIGGVTLTDYKCKTEGTLSEVVTSLITKVITTEAHYLNDIGAYKIFSTFSQSTVQSVNDLTESMGYEFLAEYSPYSMITNLNRAAHLAYILGREDSMKLSLAFNKEEVSGALFRNADDSRKVDIHSISARKGLTKSSIF